MIGSDQIGQMIGDKETRYMCVGINFCNFVSANTDNFSLNIFRIRRNKMH